MLCDICNQKATFSCCSNLPFCHVHIGQHLLIKTTHSPHQQTYRLDPLKQSILSSELSIRISNLKDTKSQIRLITRSLINTLETLQDNYLKDLNSAINRYEQLLITKDFPDLDEIEKILETQMKVKEINSEDLIDKIKEIFPTFLIEIDPHLDKERVIRKNQFLENHNGGF